MDEIFHETDAPASPPERKKVWICGACGRIDVDRAPLYMKGCGTWAVLCWEDSITFYSDTDRRACFAVAVDAEPKP